MIKLHLNSGDNVEIFVDGASCLTLNTKDEPTVYIKDGLRVGSEVRRAKGSTRATASRPRTSSGSRAVFTEHQQTRILELREKGHNSKEIARKVLRDEGKAGSVAAFIANHSRRSVTTDA